MRMFFVVDPFRGWFFGATDVLAEAIEAYIRGQNLQDLRNSAGLSRAKCVVHSAAGMAIIIPSYVAATSPAR